ncbi:TetR/AcrR family transcriptional regulator [Streptomyces sp. NPDC047108]|uniref:TetR/AcrR family transcriptional regulator n=1 Tax=Streptomyces sp. NPDC047108 TaxID=3155025 RepID=UPI0033E92B8F
MTAAIKDEAGRQLAADGAAKLSLRAHARELGMVSSAFYRYLRSRDDLPTALITDAYDAVGEAAEAALADSATTAPADRWVMICPAVCGWALAHPHEYALILGARAGLLHARGHRQRPRGPRAPRLWPPSSPTPAPTACSPWAAPPYRRRRPTPGTAGRDAERLRDRFGTGLPGPVLVDAAAAWAELSGLIGFEVFGRFDRTFEARDAYFDRAVTRLAHSLGL